LATTALIRRMSWSSIPRKLKRERLRSKLTRRLTEQVTTCDMYSTFYSKWHGRVMDWRPAYSDDLIPTATATAKKTQPEVCIGIRMFDTTWTQCTCHHSY
jgi:hypothetical protein